MDILDGWLPPTRANWELISEVWQFFPLITAIQWLTDYHPQGKTSVDSRYNLPGRYAWFLMEIPGFLTLNYIMFTLPQKLGIRELPIGNWTMAGMFTVHYIYRAILAPLFLNPSMSPIHPLVFFSALTFQIINGISIGGWLAGHGPQTPEDWQGRTVYALGGMVLWLGGFLGNMYHDDELREIRRQARREQQEKNPNAEGKVDKVYVIPSAGLFTFILYPHYFCEWIEWAGFWMLGGLACLPARTFLFNEIAAMLPRAIAGRRWYVEKFGAAKVGSRKAIIPGLI